MDTCRVTPRRSESFESQSRPLPLILAPDVTGPGGALPDLERREDFLRQAEAVYGDEVNFARDRWNAAAGMMSRGDMDGLPGGSDEDGRQIRSRARAAWLLTPREEFIPESHRSFAYQSAALPLSDGQTISAPYMVTRMTAALNPGPEHRVLEVGTGSGYQAAVLSVLTPHVHTVEYVGNLASGADTLLSDLSLRRPWIAAIRRRAGNGYLGWEEAAPYHRILVTCAIDHIPPALLDQLAPEGLLILPLGPRNVQRLVAVRRAGGNNNTDGVLPPLEIMDVYGDGTRVVFVPFVH